MQAKLEQNRGSRQKKNASMVVIQGPKELRLGIEFPSGQQL